MHHVENLDLRARRALRERALRHVKVACVTAWGSTLWSVAAFTVFADALGVSLALWRLAIAAVVTSGLGLWLWSRQSRAAAWCLGLLAAANGVLRVIATESVTPAIVSGLLCFVYYRGWRGAEVLYELRQTEEAAHPPATLSPGH